MNKLTRKIQRLWNDLTLKLHTEKHGSMHQKRFWCLYYLPAGCDANPVSRFYSFIHWGGIDQGCDHCTSSLILAIRLPGIRVPKMEEEEEIEECSDDNRCGDIHDCDHCGFW